MGLQNGPEVAGRAAVVVEVIQADAQHVFGLHYVLDTLDGANTDRGPGHQLQVDCKGISVGNVNFRPKHEFVDRLRRNFVPSVLLFDCSSLLFYFKYLCKYFFQSFRESAL